MKIIMYGQLEPEWPVYIQKQPVNYSNGSARQIEWLTDKQFDRASKKFKKYMDKERKKLNKNK